MGVCRRPLPDLLTNKPTFLSLRYGKNVVTRDTYRRIETRHLETHQNGGGNEFHVNDFQEVCDGALSPVQNRNTFRMRRLLVSITT
jgi:hypothetical protein